MTFREGMDLGHWCAKIGTTLPAPLYSLLLGSNLGNSITLNFLLLSFRKIVTQILKSVRSEIRVTLYHSVPETLVNTAIYLLSLHPIESIDRKVYFNGIELIRSEESDRRSSLDLFE